MKKKKSIFRLFVILILCLSFGNWARAEVNFSQKFNHSNSTIHKKIEPIVKYKVDSTKIISLKDLVTFYKPNQVLSYDKAREVMYTEIYNVNDTVSCMYTGYKLPLLKTEENPIFNLMKLNFFNSIIAEHSYPKSKGAKDGNAMSDMHHLFPVRLGVNVSRYNHPFGEVLVDECEVWYSANEKFKEKPSNIESNCAKEGNDKFEPQDIFKGNVARAVFYFYTMYQEEANLADDAFFELQRSTLLAWHKQDPVDEMELKRTNLIAKYQSGKANPFILDKTLAERLYGTKIHE